MGSGINAVIDFIYPPRCSLCGCSSGGEDGICADCLSQIHYIGRPLCIRCGKPFSHDFATDHLCGECLLRKRYFRRARAVGLYNGIFRKALHRFKYQWKNCLARPLGTLMAQRMESFFSDVTYHCMLPVPLHPRRLRKRGFNQALVLARIVSRAYHIPLDRNNLVRTRWTQSQVGLSERDRKDNVRGAFAVLHSGRIHQRTILLLDDIYTSGSTVDECSKVLINAGARKVDIVTLARAA
jgi:ComF family protein